jgi:hypothetical protein
MGLTEYGDKESQFIMPGNHGTNFSMGGNQLFSSAPEGVVLFTRVGGGVPPVIVPPVEPPVIVPPVTPEGSPFTANEVKVLKALVKWMQTPQP